MVTMECVALTVSTHCSAEKEAAHCGQADDFFGGVLALSLRGGKRQAAR